MARPLFFPSASLAITIGLCTCLPATAQDASSPPSMHATGLVGGVFHFAGDLGGDFATQATYPFHLAREHPGRFLLGAAALAGMVSYDGEIREAVASPEFVRDHGLAGPAHSISGVASPGIMVPVVAGVAAIGILGSERERQTSSMLAEALITSSVWTGALKQVTGRERPRQTAEELPDWTGPNGAFADETVPRGGLHSFPSGHTSGAWATATVLAHQYPTHGIVPLLAYGAAAAMGYSRMAVGAHWLSDVVVGGAIGYGCARQVISAHEGRAQPDDHDAGNGWHLFVGSAGDAHGAGLSYQF